MTKVFAKHPLPWSAMSAEGQISITDATGCQVPLQTGNIQQASLVASLANTLHAATDALLAAEYAFLWMESLGCVIEDGGTDAAQKVGFVLNDLRAGGLI